MKSLSESGRWLRKIRLSHGMSRLELSSYSHIPLKRIRDIEKGECSDIKFWEISAIARNLIFKEEDFFECNQTKPVTFLYCTIDK